MSSKTLSPGLILIPEEILWMLMELENIIQFSSQLVMTTLNLFK